MTDETIAQAVVEKLEKYPGAVTDYQRANDVDALEFIVEKVMHKNPKLRPDEVRDVAREKIESFEIMSVDIVVDDLVTALYEETLDIESQKFVLSGSGPNRMATLITPDQADRAQIPVIEPTEFVDGRTHEVATSIVVDGNHIEVNRV